MVLLLLERQERTRLFLCLFVSDDVKDKRESD